MKWLLTIISIELLFLILPLWIMTSDWSQLKWLEKQNSIAPDKYSFAVYKDNLSSNDISNIVTMLSQQYPQYSGIIVNQMLPKSQHKQDYTVTNDTGLTVLVFHFFKSSKDIMSYDSSNTNINHLFLN